MFGPRGKDTENEQNESAQTMGENGQHRTGPDMGGRSLTPTIARRGIEPVGSRRASSTDVAERKLTVGKGLSLAGEITSCDVLVVEGKVEAKLTDGKLLEITEAGQFRGSVEIESADIAGRYDGQLIVHGRLTVRSTGRISGTVKYGEIEVNAGGQIIGEMQVVGGGVQANNGFKSAAKFASSGDEEESEDRGEKRKTA